MNSAAILLIAGIWLTAAGRGNTRQIDSQEASPQSIEQSVTDQASNITLKIASVGPLLGPPTNRYQIGEQVLITIAMTNGSAQSCYTCVSSDLYQDLPTLKLNGSIVPYTKWQTQLLRSIQSDQTCQHEDLPETMLLKANEQTVVDFLTLADDSRLPTGALSWYDPLAPGTYELSIQRRLGCCTGPMIQSNKITFAVGP
jgi:hypothetical protein